MLDNDRIRITVERLDESGDVRDLSWHSTTDLSEFDTLREAVDQLEHAAAVAISLATDPYDTLGAWEKAEDPQ